MDPLTTLGVIANMVQLLDAGANAISLCHQIYKAGVSVDDSQMITTSEQLHKCYLDLNDSISKNNASGPRVFKGSTLSHFVTQCCETAKELSTELNSLRRPPGRGLHKTFIKWSEGNGKGAKSTV